MQSNFMDNQSHKSITDEVKIKKFLNDIPNILKKSITPHLTDDMTYNDIVTKSEQFKAANRVTNADHTNPGYFSKLSRDTNAASTRVSYTT